MKHPSWLKFLIIIIFSLGLLIPTAAVLADEFGLDITANAAGLNDYDESLPSLAGNVIGAGLSMVGVLFFILMVYGGIVWMTARGNEEHTKKALNTIIAACIGIVIVLASYAITSFVLSSVKSGPASNQPTPTAMSCVEYAANTGGTGGCQAVACAGSQVFYPEYACEGDARYCCIVPAP